MQTKAKLLNVREHLEAKDEMLHEILLKIKAGVRGGATVMIVD